MVYLSVFLYIFDIEQNLKDLIKTFVKDSKNVTITQYLFKLLINGLNNIC